MSLATYWTEDGITSLSTLSGFTAGPASDWNELAGINQLSYVQVIERRDDGHRAYVARIDGQPVAYGWIATRKISIGELDINVELSADDRYLWDFATLPDWQGRGLYPRLLQSILEQESLNAKRFWIIHAPENLPSGVGMNKAGFEFVGQLSFTIDGQVGLAPYLDTAERARRGAEMLHVPLIETVLAPCWNCGELTSKHPERADADSCWPPQRSGENKCCCATEVKKPGQLNPSKKQ